MKNLKFCYVIIAFVFFQLAACSQPIKKDTSSQTQTKTQAPLLANPFYNNMALAIAGMMPDTSGLFKSVTNKNVWKNYAQSSDTTWKKVFDKSLDKIKLWADTELTDINKKTATLFYPFSGPDFMYANTFFPYAKTYILFGLEKPGTLPDLTKMTETNMTQFLASVNQSLQDILNLSFFKTIKMSSQLNNANVDGVLPIILLFMARTGNTITDVNSAYIDNTGKIAVNDTLFNAKTGTRYGKGIEISFFKDKQDTAIRKVYYFSADLTEEALAGNQPVKLFMQKLDSGVTTFLKSASYLLHNSLFTTVRNTILAKSNYVLQDDSGIAFHFYDKKTWGFTYYGVYDKPIDVFSYCYQKDLNAEFLKGAKTFDFKYGYGKGRNMLLSRKIGK